MVAYKESLEQISVALIRRGWRLVTAESCTGGLLSGRVTSLPGSSNWFECGFVTYSNEAKSNLLDVPLDLIDRFGAVSAEVVEAMVVGALKRAKGDVAVAISGIAGPGGAVQGKPVGTVFIAWGDRNGMVASRRFSFSGDREDVRHQAVSEALSGLAERYA